MAAPRIDLMLELKEMAVASILLANGGFEKELKKIASEKAQLEDLLKKRNALDTLDAAKKEAENFCAKQKKAADNAMAPVIKAQEALANEMAQILQKEKALAIEVEKFNTQKNNFDTEKADFAKLMAKNTSDARKLMEDAISMGAKAKAQAEDVAQREAEIQRKMDVLKSL
jgi:hypothetical protein